MKKLFYLMFLSLVPMLFTSCSDDESTGVGSVETLYGTWQAVHGYAIEDGERHHANDISADETEYLKFGNDSICLIYVTEGAHRGHFSYDRDYSYSFTSSFTYDEDTKVLEIGSMTFIVEILNGSTLRLRSYYNYTNDYEVVTYKKVSDKIWNNL